MLFIAIIIIIIITILSAGKEASIQYRKRLAHPGFITNSNIVSLPLAGVYVCEE